MYNGATESQSNIMLRDMMELISYLFDWFGETLPDYRPLTRKEIEMCEWPESKSN